MLLVILLVLAAVPSLMAQRVHVRGYTRKNGTYVAPHTRAAPGTASSSPRNYTAPREYRPPRVKTETPSTATKAVPFGAVRRNPNGRIERSETAKHQFMVRTGFPQGRSGYVIDHIVPLACGGADVPENMQWQTVAEGKVKDKTERRGCDQRSR
jgi:hypothetical protein